jgi:hypothetical protein
MVLTRLRTNTLMTRALQYVFISLSVKCISGHQE